MVTSCGFWKVHWLGSTIVLDQVPLSTVVCVMSFSLPYSNMVTDVPVWACTTSSEYSSSSAYDLLMGQGALSPFDPTWKLVLHWKGA